MNMILAPYSAVFIIFFFLKIRPPPVSTLFPYTTLFRSAVVPAANTDSDQVIAHVGPTEIAAATPDRQSTRLNSSHVSISYAVFCLNQKIVRFLPRARDEELQRCRYDVSAVLPS